MKTKESSTKKFIVIFFIFTLSFLFIFIGLKIFITLYKNDTSLWSSIADALNIIFGLPIAFAGSVVAILLAERALSVSHRQEYQENIKYISDAINSIYDVYWTIWRALRTYFFSVSELIKIYNSSLVDDEEKVALISKHIDKVIETREMLLQAFNGIAKNEMTLKLWKKKCLKIDNSMFNRYDYGSLDSSSNFLPLYNINDIANIINSFDYFEEQDIEILIFNSISRYFDTDNAVKYYEKYLEERDAESIARDSDEIIHYAKNVMRSETGFCDLFLVSGLCIHKRSYVSEETGYQHINSGASFLIDFCQLIPDNNDIIELVSEQVIEHKIDSDKITNAIKRIVGLRTLLSIFPSIWLDTAAYLLTRKECPVLSSEFVGKERFWSSYAGKNLIKKTSA